MFRNAGTATLGRVLGRGVGYIAQIILARALAPEGYGLFAIGWTLLRLFSIAGHLGLDYGVVKFGSQYWQKDALKLRSVALFSIGTALLSGLIFGSAMYISAPWLAQVVFKKEDLELIIKGLALAFPFATALRVLAATTSLSGNMLCGAVAEDMAQPALQMVLFIFLFNSGMGLSAALISTTVSYGISVALGILCVARVIPGIFSFGPVLAQDFWPLYKFSLPAIVGVTLGAFNLWGDRLLVGYFGSEVDTGIYQSISTITMFTTIVLSGIKISIAPVISQMHHNSNYAGIKSLIKAVTRWALYVSTPILLIVFIDADSVILGVFGKAYLNGALPLIILTIGQVFYIMFGAIDQVYLMTGNQKEWLRISAGIFMLTFILDALLIPRMHLIGASIVSSAMMLLLGGISATVLHHRLRFWLFDIFHLKIIAAAAITALLIGPVASSLHLGLLPNLLITFFGICTVFTTLLWFAGIEATDKAALQQYTKRLF